MRRVAPLILIAVLLLAGGEARASDQSKRLASRGLVDFHAGRYAKALELFDQAVAADGQDARALYYRAMTRERLDDVNGAISDLRAALSAQPDFDEAALELGVALVQAGQYQEATPPLEQARRLADQDGQASLFLGIAQLRLDQTAAALVNFQRAAKDPKWTRAARYYQGVATYRLGDWDQADQHFSAVASESPNSDMGREAAAFLAKIHQGEVANYTLYGAVGFQYDSNVVLAPSSGAIADQLAISQQADGRATLDVGGTYVPWSNDWAQLLVGYEAYQSVHLKLSKFNIQDHRPSVEVAANAGVFRLGLLGRYDYYLLQTKSFLQEATALPWVAVPEGSLGRTEVFYRMRRRDFKKQVFFVRDSFNHAAGLTQYLYLNSPDRYVSVGYQFDREDPVINDRRLTPGEFDPNSFAYDGNEVNTGLGWSFPQAITGETHFFYRHERYAAQSDGRRDDVYQVLASLRKRVDAHLDLTLAYLGTINNSNNVLFNYERHIGSLGLEVRF